MSMAQMVASLIAIVLVLALAFILRLTVSRLDLSPEQRQRTRNTIRYGLLLLTVVFFVAVWAEELKSAALILSAFAVAIVLASKELLMCVGGWWLKTMGGAFRIGDRIEVGKFKGDVMDYGVLATTLMEVGPQPGTELRSGSVITVPNSLFLSQTVRNLTHSLDYSWRTLDIVVEPDSDWKHTESTMVTCARELVDEYRAEMDAQLDKLEKRYAFHAIHSEPTVFASLCEDGRIKLTLRVGLPVRGLRRVEDRLTRKILDQRKE